MLLMALMGMAALVIDMGLARLTARQMETAAAGAALEGLRGRDREEIADETRDLARRQAASDHIAMLFDDDLRPESGDLRPFGAGPEFALTGGAGDVRVGGSRKIEIGATPVYKPRRSDDTLGLELNEGNAAHGDMVAGEYHAAQSHSEDGSYARADFTPSEADDEVPGGAFLVRLRRAYDDDGLGLDSDPGVSSNGPPIPFLFGQGAMLPAADPVARYSPRHHGITVRATAIADAKRAKSVGAAIAERNIAGGLPFVIFQSSWEGNDQVESRFPPDTAVTITVQPSGELTVGRTVIGYVTESTGASQAWQLGMQAGSVEADSFSPAGFVTGLVASLPAVAPRGYAPLIPGPNENSAIPDRVIGFGYAGDIAPVNGRDDQFTLTRRGNRIAYRNASAVLTARLDDVFSDDSPTDPELTELLSRHQAIARPLLAPALVRSWDPVRNQEP